jgi:hypothetical protein
MTVHMVNDPKPAADGNKPADTLKDKAGSLASSVLDEVKQEGRRAAEHVRDDVERLGETQKDRVADRIGNVAGTMRGASEDLRTKEENVAAGLADTAADHLQKFSDSLVRKDLGTLFDDASDLARRYPAIFLGGAVMLGFMAARFAKSSRRDDDRIATAHGSDGSSG